MRVLAWVSGGAASVIAAKLAIQKYGDDVVLVRCETNNEDPDNERFEKEAEAWLGKKVTHLKSEKFDSVPDVWKRRRFMSGPMGAPCTLAMKVEPRLKFQRPDDRHVFGYTADATDAARFKRLRETYFELDVEAPLVDGGITKNAVLHMVQTAGLELPRSYSMGFPNANCLQTGCVKATSPNYWALYREKFPEQFKETAKLSREIGARLARLRGERVFIDEIPDDWPTLDPIVPACDFLCAIAEDGLND